MTSPGLPSERYAVQQGLEPGRAAQWVQVRVDRQINGIRVAGCDGILQLRQRTLWLVECDVDERHGKGRHVALRCDGVELIQQRFGLIVVTR